jgi:hypothetical protein
VPPRISALRSGLRFSGMVIAFVPNRQSGIPFFVSPKRWVGTESTVRTGLFDEEVRQAGEQELRF